MKWFLGDEAEIAAAVRVRDAIVAGDVAAAVPSLLGAELAHAVVRAVRRSRVSAEAASAIVSTYARFEEALGVVAVAGTRAVEAALAAGVGAYDGAYLALARDRVAPLVTADRKLAEAAARVGVLALTLGELSGRIDTQG